MKPPFNIGNKIQIVHELSHYPPNIRQLHKQNGYLVIQNRIECPDGCAFCHGFSYGFAGVQYDHIDDYTCEIYLRQDAKLYQFVIKKPKKFKLKKKM